MTPRSLPCPNQLEAANKKRMHHEIDNADKEDGR
jgi:hypothetical protein